MFVCFCQFYASSLNGTIVSKRLVVVLVVFLFVNETVKIKLKVRKNS